MVTVYTMWRFCQVLKEFASFFCPFLALSLPPSLTPSLPPLSFSLSISLCLPLPSFQQLIQDYHRGLEKVGREKHLMAEQAIREFPHDPDHPGKPCITFSPGFYITSSDAKVKPCITSLGLPRPPRRGFGHQSEAVTYSLGRPQKETCRDLRERLRGVTELNISPLHLHG